MQRATKTSGSTTSIENIRGTCEILSGPGTGRYAAWLSSVLVTGKPEAGWFSDREGARIYVIENDYVVPSSGARELWLVQRDAVDAAASRDGGV